LDVAWPEYKTLTNQQKIDRGLTTHGVVMETAIRKAAEALGINLSTLPVIPYNQGSQIAFNSASPSQVGSLEEFKKLMTQPHSTAPLVNMEAKAKAEMAKAPMTGAELEAAGGLGSTTPGAYDENWVNGQRGTTGQFVEGKAYKNPNNAKIFLYKDGQMHWIQDGNTFKQIFGGLPQEDLNFTTLPTTSGITFGETINTSNVNNFTGAGEIAGTAGGTAGDAGAGGGTGATNEANLANALALIDASNLPPDLKIRYKTIISNFPEGMEVNPENILAAFDEIQTGTIDPHIAELINATTAVLEDQLTDVQQARRLEEQNEQATAAARIRNAQADLEARGMTFSGEAERALGGQSAYLTEYEGEVPQYNRLVASSSSERYLANLRNIGREVEERLGSGALGGFDIPGYQAIGGQTGSIETQRQGLLAETLQQLINNANATNAANTNL